MKKHTLLTTMLGLLAAPVVFAQWTLVDDFEQNNLNDWWFTDHIKVGDDPLSVPDGVRQIIGDPIDGGGNLVFFYSAGPPNSFGNIRSGSNRPLPFELPVGTVGSPNTVTFYMRFAPGGTSLDFNFGLSDVAQDRGIIDPRGGPLPFNTFEYQVRISLADFLVPTVRFAGSFENAVGVSPVAPLTWYEIWLVINLQPTDSFWQAYIKGGPEFPELTRLEVTIEVSGTPFTINNFLSRNNDDESLKTVLIAANAGNEDLSVIGGTDPMFFDDMYVDPTGENLTSPMAQATPAVPEPTITRSGSQITIGFQSEMGVTYTVEASGTGASDDFTDVSGPLVGDGSVLEFMDTISGDRQFYQVVAQ